MAISRYTFVNKLSFANNNFYGTSHCSTKINKAVNNGLLTCEIYTLKEGERIDQIAFRYYGDASYWWVIAAASGIGWSLQIPPGTILRVPSNLSTALGVSR